MNIARTLAWKRLISPTWKKKKKYAVVQEMASDTVPLEFISSCPDTHITSFIIQKICIQKKNGKKERKKHSTTLYYIISHMNYELCNVIIYSCFFFFLCKLTLHFTNINVMSTVCMTNANIFFFPEGTIIIVNILFFWGGEIHHPQKSQSQKMI